jgi:hypothetical protein
MCKREDFVRYVVMNLHSCRKMNVSCRGHKMTFCTARSHGIACPPGLVFPGKVLRPRRPRFSLVKATLLVQIVISGFAVTKQPTHTGGGLKINKPTLPSWFTTQRTLARLYSFFFWSACMSATHLFFTTLISDSKKSTIVPVRKSLVQWLTESRFGISKFGIPIEIRTRLGDLKNKQSTERRSSSSHHASVSAFCGQIRGWVGSGFFARNSLMLVPSP